MLAQPMESLTGMLFRMLPKQSTKSIERLFRFRLQLPQIRIPEENERNIRSKHLHGGCAMVICDDETGPSQ